MKPAIPPPMTSTRIDASTNGREWLRRWWDEAQDSACGLHVPGDLGAHRLDAGEPGLVAEPGHEPQLDALPVEVAGEVEEIGLHAQVGARELRPVADADGGAPLPERGAGPAR